MIAASIISILSIVILGAGCIYLALETRDAKDDLYTANHLKKLYKECLDKKEIEVLDLEEENGRLTTLVRGSHDLLEHVRDNIEAGVFYDKVNDAIVYIPDLDKIGDL